MECLESRVPVQHLAQQPGQFRRVGCSCEIMWAQSIQGHRCAVMSGQYITKEVLLVTQQACSNICGCPTYSFDCSTKEAFLDIILATVR